MTIRHVVAGLLAALCFAWNAAADEPPTRVAILGDIVSWGSRVTFDESWDYELRRQLGDGYLVRNFGGLAATLSTTDAANDRNTLEAVYDYLPDVVIVARGSLDATRQERIDEPALQQGLGSLVDSLQRISTSPVVLLCTPPDVVPDTPRLSDSRTALLRDRQAQLDAICRSILAVGAQADSERVRVVDLHSVTTGRPEYMIDGDGVQMSEAGHIAVAQALLATIVELDRKPAVRTDRPNIILFIVDDLGWQDTSVPFHTERTPLNDRYRTPNLEALAARGTKFTNAYASAPVCTPTRTSILTGKAPARTHITYWTLHKDTDTSRHRDDIAAPAWSLNGLQPGEHDLLPEILRGAGYRTIHVGKAHFGVHDSPGGDPTNLGFTVNIAGHASGGPASYYGLDHFTVAGRQGKPPHSNPSVWDIPGLDAYHGHDIYLTEALAIEASRAIYDSVEAGEPFYMNFAPYAVHAPIMGNRKYEPNYPDLDERERAYASMVETYDAALGALVTTLEEAGQLDNTVIIFTSDNGGLSAHARGAAPDGNTAHTHNAPLRSGKGSAYEGGTRVPTIIAWPGVTDTGAAERSNAVVDTPIVSHDLFPTIVSLAGIAGDFEHGIDGRDLTPLLTNRPHLFDSTRTLGWNQPHQWGASGPGIWPFTGIRRGEWKLLYFHAGRRFELYNLADDIGETFDLAGEAPTLVSIMADAMTAWIDSTDAQLSIDRSTGNEIERPNTVAAALVGGPPPTRVAAPSPETRSRAAGWGERSWMDQFEDIKHAAAELEPRIVLIGDSITQGWAGPGRQVGGAGAAARAAHLDPLGPVLNAGIAGDRTQHVLWRLEHGMLDGCDPEVITLMIGTNNLADDNAEAILEGIDAILNELSRRAPDATVLLVGVPPRGRTPDELTRRRGAFVNREIARLVEGGPVRWLDLTPLLVDEHGLARTDRMAGDFVHFSGAGYEAVAVAMRDAIEAALSR